MSVSAPTQPGLRKPAALWRRVLAIVLDSVFVFAIAGYTVGYLTGHLTDNGFNLEGGPALIVFAAIALYFVVFTRFLGGTPWQRLLGVR